MADAKISAEPRSYPLSSVTSDGLQVPLGLSEDIPQRFLAMQRVSRAFRLEARSTVF
jgi:hypothetical protein